MAYITQKHVWELPFPVYIEKYSVDPPSIITAKYYSTSVLDPQLNTSNKHILSAHLLNFVQGMKFRNRKCLLMKKEQTTTSENSAPNAVFVEMSGSPTSCTESNMIWGSIYNCARWMLGYPPLDMTQSTDVTNIPFLWNSFKTRLGYGETLGAPPLSSDSTPASKPAGTGSAGTKASSPEMSGSPTSFTESNTVWSSMYDYARWMFGYPPSDTTQSTDVTDTPSLWNSFKTRLGYGETSVATQLSSDSTPASRTPGVSPLSSDSTETSKTSGPRSAGIRESSVELFTQPNSFHRTDESDIDSRERLREFDPNRSENEPSHSRTERSRSILSTGKRTSDGKLVKFDGEISASKSDLTETTETGLGKDDLMTRTDSFDDSGSHKKKGQLFYKIVAVKDSIDSIHVEVSGESIDVVGPPETETEGNAKKR